MSSTPSNPENIDDIRAELAASVDELFTRVSPKNVASEAATKAKTATADVAAFVTGGGLPDPQEGTRARNAKALLGVAAGLVSVVALTFLSRKKK